MDVEYSISMLDFIKQQYLQRKNAAFLEFYGKKISFDDFFSYVDDCAENFARFGVGKGDVVTLALPKCPQFVIAVYALSKVGAICSLLSPLSSKNSIEKTLTKTGSKIVIISTLTPYDFDDVGAKTIRVHFNYFMPFIKKAVLEIKKHYSSGFAFENLLAKTYEPFVLKNIPDCNAPAFYLHSGGTTGEPKTVILSQKAVNYCALTITENIRDNGIKEGDDIVAAYILPVFYGYGLGVLHTQLYNGYSHVIRAKFKPEDLAKDFSKQNVNLMFGVPVMYAKMLKTGLWNSQKVKNLRLCYIGGEKLSEELLGDFNKAFPNASLVEGYGMTEAVTAFVACSKNNYKLNSCGKVGSFVKVEAFSENGELLSRGKEGELCVRSGALMNGYLDGDNSVLFDFEGEKWLKTGDFGRVDEDGFIFLVQRIKNIIKRKGINIFPSQVEVCVSELPFVEKVKVFGYKDKTSIERIVCAVVLKDAPENAINVIKEHVKENISILSTPEYVMIVDEFPMTNVGKVDAKKLLEKVDASAFDKL